MKVKKKVSQRLYDWVFGETKRPAKRAFAAAKVNRHNADWTTRPSGANREMRESLAILRARARQMARDNSHFKKFLSMVRSNLIGPGGIQLQANAKMMDGSLNVKVNQMVEAAWKLWGRPETCTLSGRLDWLHVQRLIVTQLARDGEFLVQKVRDNNPFGFSLKVWDVNWLDETWNQTQPNGNRIIMSVEVDANDRPVAYWLTQPAVEMLFSQRQNRQRIRVPASEIIHGFLSFDDETQVRGVTWFAAAMLDAKGLAGYREGVIISARFAAYQLGFIETEPDENGNAYTGAEDEDGRLMAPEIDYSPGSVSMLNPGQKFTQSDPKQPTQNHPEFVNSLLLGVAAGLDICGFELSGDLTQVNFSSARVGKDESRDIWRGLQDFVSTTLCREVFHAWAHEAFLAGSLKLTAKEFAEIQNPDWRARGWKYIDPTKDIAADVDRLRNRLTTPSMVLAEQGIDYATFLERWKADKELAARYDIDIETIYTEPKAAAAADPNATEPAADPPARGYLNGHDMDEMLN